MLVSKYSFVLGPLVQIGNMPFLCKKLHGFFFSKKTKMFILKAACIKHKIQKIKLFKFKKNKILRDFRHKFCFPNIVLKLLNIFFCLIFELGINVL